MKFERTVVGVAVTIHNGMTFLVPDSLGICIQKLQETLDKQERQIHNQKESITTYQKTEKGLEESLVGRKSQIDRQAKTIYDQKAEIAKLTIEVDSRNRDIAAYKEASLMASDLVGRLRTANQSLLSSVEQKIRELDVAKATCVNQAKELLATQEAYHSVLAMNKQLRDQSTETDTPQPVGHLCKLHSYLASDEAEAQRLDIYKAVMEQIRKHVICSNISTDELLRIRQMLV